MKPLSHQIYRRTLDKLLMYVDDRLSIKSAFSEIQIKPVTEG